MGMKSSIEVSERLETLKELQAKQRNIKSEKRILRLILLKTNKFKTHRLIATYLGICRQTLVLWMARYRKLGIEGILLSSTRAKKSKIITPEIHQGLSEKLKDAKLSLRGSWDAQQWVLSHYGVEVKYHWLSAYMIKYFKTKLKSPRKSHYKKDAEAVKAFLKTLPTTLNDIKSNLNTGKFEDVNLYVQDESSFGLMTHLGKYLNGKRS